MTYAHNYDAQDGIAIVGMAGRFPGARDIDKLWRILIEGRETLSTFAAEELEPSFPEDMEARDDPHYVRRRGILDGIDEFDDAFFGFSPAEAALLDPQQRLFLQSAWAALEHAGHDARRFDGPIGVFAGGTANSYYLNNLQSRRDLTDRLGLLTTQMGNQGHYIATRVAYKLDLHGPALNIHTACSTSLVAVCTAVQSLQTFQCDMALAGGVSVTVPQKRGYRWHEGSILSPDGHCRAFDSEAAGTVFGNGLGVVVLRRLADAVADGDTIYAVIKGTGLNNDGSLKLSFTAPSVDGQAQAIAMAQAAAGIDPQTIGYIEAHGTGTALGDPIEIAALTQAFRAGGAQGTGFCAIGSIKANIGHLDAAAGVTGLIKTALCLHHGVLPASLHFNAPNPKLALETSPFVVNRERRDWPRSEVPRRAGVSSFGVGGTNAHVVLEEAPSAGGVRHDMAAGEQLLVLSARDESALERASGALAQHLTRGCDAPLGDIAFTLQSGRRAFECRRAVAAGSLEQAAQLLSVSAAGRRVADEPRVAFLFPGQGAQRVQMGRGLYEAYPVYRDAIDAAAGHLESRLGLDVRQVLFPASDAEARAAEQLRQTAITQPVLFAVEHALARLWMSWGIAPQALIGHSVGEFVAACLGGTFELADALDLLVARGSLMQALPPGAMLAVRAPAQALQSWLGDDVGIAALNAPNLTVVSGPLEAIRAFSERLGQREIGYRLLETSHAFHSSMMDPVLEAFAARVAATPRQAPRLPWISGLTGAPVTPEEATSPTYWARQLREPVQFMTGMQALADPGLALLEVGPGTALGQFARQQFNGSQADVAMPLCLNPSGGRAGLARPWGRSDERVIASSLPHARSAAEDRLSLLAALGQLWCHGLAPDWTAVRGASGRRRVALPTYPFAPHRRWIDPAPATAQADPTPVAVPASPFASPGASTADPGTVAAALAAPTVHETHPNPNARMMLDPLTPIVNRLQEIFAELAGIDPGKVSPQAHFLELGLDSLLLTQASHALHKKLGVPVPMRALLEDFSSVAALAAHLAPQLPAQQSAPTAPLPETPAAQASPASQRAAAPPGPMPLPATWAAPAGAADASGPWAAVFAQQLQLMAQQLELLRGATPMTLPSATVPQVPAVAAAGLPGLVTPAPAQRHLSASAATAPVPSAIEPVVAAPAVSGAPASAAFGPYRPPSKGQAQALGARAQAQLDEFIARYNRRTAGSKAATQQHRGHLADPRSVSGFRQVWKELVYPLVTVRSEGSSLWDVDGHRYVDITNGFGMILFGHNPPFIRDAVARQLEAGYEIGPQTPLAGEVARLLCEMVGQDRAAFCGTGSEAVTAAIRVARTVTGRDKIVMFNGAYHGIFDEVLARPLRGGSDAVPRSAPIAPGIPASMTENVIILEYGAPQSLAIIESLGQELAAVLVEPVQSRRPDLQPREFLLELRRLTTASSSALIFDEVVTGLRTHPGGAQAVFGVHADIATYGKVVGGGLPIGVVAGSARFMDALDGGPWQFGDDSAPEVGVTFFAGTFVRHPLALAAARAVLNRLQAEGPELQRQLNLRTTRFVEELQRTARALGAPLSVPHFSSWFCLQFPAELPMAPLFFAAMRLRGVHVWEGRPCFLTLAHSDEDLRLVLEAVRESLAEMQAAGFLSADPAVEGSRPPGPGARLGRDREGRQAWFVPDPQRPGKFLQMQSRVTEHG